MSPLESHNFHHAFQSWRWILLLCTICIACFNNPEVPPQHAQDKAECPVQYAGPESFDLQQRDAFCHLAFTLQCSGGLAPEDPKVQEACATYNDDVLWGTSTHPVCPYCTGISVIDAVAPTSHIGKEIMFFSRYDLTYQVEYRGEALATLEGNTDKFEIPFIKDQFTSHFTLEEPGNDGDLRYLFKVYIYTAEGVQETIMSFDASLLEAQENYIEIDEGFRVWTVLEILELQELCS